MTYAKQYVGKKWVKCKCGRTMSDKQRSQIKMPPFSRHSSALTITCGCERECHCGSLATASANDEFEVLDVRGSGPDVFDRVMTTYFQNSGEGTNRNNPLYICECEAKVAALLEADDPVAEDVGAVKLPQSRKFHVVPGTQSDDELKTLKAKPKTKGHSPSKVGADLTTQTDADNETRKPAPDTRAPARFDFSPKKQRANSPQNRKALAVKENPAKKVDFPSSLRKRNDALKRRKPQEKSKNAGKDASENGEDKELRNTLIRSLSGHSPASNIKEKIRQDPLDHECIETYGDTILDHFRKEELEKNYQIYDKPRLFSARMRILIAIMELTIIVLFSVFIHWIVVVRKATFGFFDVVGVVSKSEEEHQGKTIDPAKLDIHFTIYMTIFVILLPHVLILSVVLEFISTTRLTAITFSLKLLSFCLFFGGLFDIQAAVGSTYEDERKKDFKTHYCFSQGAVVVFIMYIIITSVKLAGHLFRRIFQIRILGSILRVVVSDWFVDSVDHLTYGAGYFSLLTGLCGYLFISTQDGPFDLTEDTEHKMTTNESWHIRSICILMAVLYFTILLVNFQKHFITNHTNFITVDIFKDVFLPFRALYEEENIMEMGQDMPKVTSAQRMV